MVKFTVAIIAAAAAVSGPAFAEKYEAKVVEKYGQTFYCVKQQVTASFIPARTCVTQNELEAEGAKVASAQNNAVLALNDVRVNSKN